jgi:hypothetical protein
VGNHYSGSRPETSGSRTAPILDEWANPERVLALQGKKEEDDPLRWEMLLLGTELAHRTLLQKSQQEKAEQHLENSCKVITQQMVATMTEDKGRR